MTDAQIFDKVKTILFDRCVGHDCAIEVDSNFQEDLGMDSLDAVEVIMLVEDDFKIEIFDDEMDAVKTVQQMIELVQKKQNASV